MTVFANRKTSVQMLRNPHEKKASVEECDCNPKDVRQRQEGSEDLVASQSSQCVGSRLSETPSLNE